MKKINRRKNSRRRWLAMHIAAFTATPGLTDKQRAAKVRASLADRLLAISTPVRQRL